MNDYIDNRPWLAVSIIIALIALSIASIRLNPILV